MATLRRIGKTATSLKRDADGTIQVTYHATTVVKVEPNGDVVLDHGGYQTLTTKTRMNQASNELSLGYEVYQKKGHWFVIFKGEDFAFDSTPLTLKK